MLPARDATPAPPHDRALARAAPFAVFALVALAIAAAWLLAWRAAARSFRESRARVVASVVALKVEQVVRWRDERLSDAQALAHDPNLSDALAPSAGPRSRGEAGLATWLEQVQPIADYTGAALVDADGRVVLAAGRVDAAHGALRELVRRATAERRPVISELHGSADDPSHVDVVAPVGGRGGGAPGALVLRVDPRPYLFREIASWHEPSGSAEVLLLRAGRGGAEALNAPRSGAAAARFPEGGAIAAAVAGRRPAPIQAVDQRGVEVIGAVAPVPGSPWSVLAKEDAAETLAPLRERALTIGIAALGLLVAAGAVLAYSARRQSDRLAVAAAERSALQRRIARLTAHAHDMVFLADDRQRIVDANDLAVQVLGYPREELIGLDVRALRDPDTLADYPRRVQDQLEHGAALFETRYRRKDGSTFPVAVSVHADELEGRRWFEAVACDISDRKRTEDALRESEAKFRAAFEFASLGVVLLRADGRIVETNRALREMTGYSEVELRGAHAAVLHDPADPLAPDELLARLTRGEADLLERPRRLRRKDGTFRETVVRASALRDDAGRLGFLLVAVEDVSEQRRLQAQLLLADRMASVGTLAAGVAHEINNPLAFILSNLDFAVEELRRGGADPEVLRALDDAKDGGVRVREIVRDLKTFARPADEVREALDVRAVLQSAVGLASNEIRHRARLVVEAGEVPRVAASAYRLAQVLVNLLINAAQAIPEGRSAEHVVRVATGTAPDGRAVIEISDTGVGIAPDVLPRIFDPFFTTKAAGGGTGLGLSICHGIVTQLGGEISVESTPGEGSTFRVSLPPTASPGAPSPRAAPRAPPLAPVRPTRILVVDDEPLVGRAVARVLGDAHDVTTRTSARDALAELLGDGRFDVVLCDLMMPDMTGMELHDRLARAAPTLAARVVFLTGGAFTSAAREFLDRVPNLRLEKPFEPQALRAIVAGALAGRAPPPAAA